MGEQADDALTGRCGNKSMTEQVEAATLDDVLSGKAEEPVTQDAGVSEPEPKAEAQPEPDVTNEAPTPDANKEPAEPKEEWTKAAVLDERRKRQALERDLAAMRKAAEQQPKRPDVFEDPDGAFRHEREQFAQQIHATRLELTQELMRDAHTDYDELESEFIDLAKANPFLLQQLQQARNPARFAYETAKKARDAAALQDVGKLRADIEAKIRAELEEKLRKEVEESLKRDGKKREALAPSLAAAQSKGAMNEAPDESLDSILKRK